MKNVKETLAELSEVLRRPHLDRYRIFEERMEFFERYRDLVTLHEATAVITDCRDPKDNKFLSLAVSTASSIIVASDEDLRVLHPYGDIQILSPLQFVNVTRTLLKP